MEPGAFQHSPAVSSKGHEIRDLFIDRPNESPVGLFGFAGEEAVIKDVNMVNVTVTGYYYIGGRVRYNNGVVTNSYSTGNVSGTVGTVGGLVGDNWDGAVSDSYATGSVTGSSCVGGLVAYSNRGTVIDSYSTGGVTGGDDVGGLVGRSYDGTTGECFWDTETSGQATSAGGTGNTTAEMMDFATFSGAGWNIWTVAPGSTNSTRIWNIVDGLTYPFLSWQ